MAKQKDGAGSGAANPADSPATGEPLATGTTTVMATAPAVAPGAGAASPTEGAAAPAVGVAGVGVPGAPPTGAAATFDPKQLSLAQLAMLGMAAAGGQFEQASQAGLLKAAREKLERQLRFGPQFDRMKPPVPTETDLNQFDNILGIAFGTKISGEVDTGQPCIQVYVRKKVDPKDAGEAAIPPEVLGVPTDIIEIGGIEMRVLAVQQDLSIVQQAAGFNSSGLPVRCGMGVGSPMPGQAGSFNVGTIGFVCRAKGVPAFISNNHVLALNDRIPNPAIIGQGHPFVGWRGDNQPHYGPIGSLLFRPSLTSGVDAALAFTSSSQVSSQHAHFTLSPQPIFLPDDVQLFPPHQQYPVKKVGYRTGLSVGVVTSTSFDAQVRRFDGTVAHLPNQIMIRSSTGGIFSQQGDSGAGIVSNFGPEMNRPVGLLWGGAQNNSSITFACPIRDVINRLGITEFINGPY